MLIKGEHLAFQRRKFEEQKNNQTYIWKYFYLIPREISLTYSEMGGVHLEDSEILVFAT